MGGGGGGRKVWCFSIACDDYKHSVLFITVESPTDSLPTHGLIDNETLGRGIVFQC